MSHDHECKELGCTKKAVKEWNGMVLCIQHYDKHEHDHDSMMKDFA